MTDQDGYTPSDTEVREAIAEWSWSRRMFRPELGSGDGREADRWLAAHDAEVRAADREALADTTGVDANEEHDGDDWWAGYRQAQRDQARRLSEKAKEARGGK